MSFYGGERRNRFPSPPRRRDATYDLYNNSRQPVTNTNIVGGKARITVETRDDNAKARQYDRPEDLYKGDSKAARIDELKRRRGVLNRAEKPACLNLASPRVRRSSPIRSAYSSPIRRHHRPLDDDYGKESRYYGENIVKPIASPHDSEEDVSDYDFDVSGATKGVKFATTTTVEVAHFLETNKFDELVKTGKPKFNGQMTALSIAHARWVGSSLERGEVSAEILTIPPDIPASDNVPTPSVRWYHLERPMLNFEEFMAASVSVLELPEKEIREVTKLLRDVQKRFEKQRHHGRDMDPDCVSDVFYTSGTGSLNKRKQTESVMFLSFPYFSLDLYSSAQIKALTSEDPMHPLRPILQAQFYATSRQRELMQVISRVPGTPEGHCLHLSQVWVLIINDSTMITCSRLGLGSLRGESIQQTHLATASETPRIKVYTKDNRSWRLPVFPEMSWPAFLSAFSDSITELETYGGTVQFEHDYGVVDGTNWPDFLNTALESASELRMVYKRFRDSDFDQDSASESAESGSYEGTTIGAVPTERGSEQVGPATITFLADRRKSSRDVSNLRPSATLPLETTDTLQLFKHTGSTSYMRGLADSFNTILRTNNRSKEKAAYKKCAGAKSTDVEAWMASHGDDGAEMQGSLVALSIVKCKRRFASLSRHLFSFFWPAEFEHAVTDKYWGAVYHILNRQNEFFMQGSRDPDADLTEALEFYEHVHSVLPSAMGVAKEFLTYENELRPLPDRFSKAWLHIVTALVLAADRTLNKKARFVNRDVDGHLQAMREDLLGAKRELAARLRTVELEELEVCRESGLLSLILSRLAKDNMRGRPDVARAYGDYFQGLEFSITQDPVPRSHQETIRFFLQEVEAILSTLQNQISVIEVLEQSLEQQAEHDDLLFEEALGESRQTLVIESCRAWILGRIDKFKGLQQRALELGEWQRNEMDTNKDRQEKAILVFTIVTIIFLPLSFVASVFGMNTKDVRDMPYRQWVYWAAGLPLTIVVIIVSLWFAGELESLGMWLKRKAANSKPSPGFEPLPARMLATDWRGRGKEGGYYGYVDLDLEGRPPRPRRRTTYPVKEG